MVDQAQPDPYVPSEVATSPDVYADRTVDQIKGILRDSFGRDALTADELRALYVHEAMQKDRITLLDFLADNIRSRGGEVPDHPDAVAHAERQMEAEAEAQAAEQAADDVTEEPTPNDDTADYDPDGDTLVTIRAPSTGYYHGHWFDDAGTKVAEWDTRLERGVRNGDLDLVAVRDETAIPPDLRL